MPRDHKHPLYNSTYSLYSVSPLQHADGSLLNPTDLRIQACRLRDVLKGDTLRGVHVGTDTTDASLNAAGKLKDCTWDLLDEDLLWADPHATSPTQKAAQQNGPFNRRTIAAKDSFGIHIQLHFEHAVYDALFLRNIAPIPSSTSSSTRDPGPGFTALPLLLVRIPQPTRQAVISHLSSTFDSHIAPLHLRSEFLTHALELLLHRVGPSEQNESDTTVTSADTETLVKALHLQIALPTVSPLLKTMDISIAAEDVPKLLHQGSDSGRNTEAPFTTALSKYLTSHLALTQSPFPEQSTAPPLSHPPKAPIFSLTKIACAPVALARDGKLKLIPPPPLAAPPRRGPASAQANGSSSEDPARTICMRALRELLEDVVREAEKFGMGES